MVGRNCVSGLSRTRCGEVGREVGGACCEERPGRDLDDVKG